MSWWWYFARYAFDARVRGLHRPILGGLKITHRCTMRCVHCPYWRRPASDMPWDTVRSVLGRMHDDGVRILIIEGGEPLLWQDRGQGRTLHDVIALAREMFFSVGVTTNGTLPIAGLDADAVWVSFDGLRDVFTRIRGDFFDKVVQNMQTAGHRNLYANVTINRLNASQVGEIVAFLAPIVKGVTIQFHYPYGTAEDEALFLPLDERAPVLDRLIAMKREGFPVADSEGTLVAMKDNSWRCQDWMLENADPDGTVAQGCYLRNRGTADCRKCGFAAHAEISRAFDLSPSAILTGMRIFKYRNIQ